MPTNQSAIIKGVSDAWDFWLSQHDISTPQLMEDAIKKAMRDWLDENGESIIAAIASSARSSGMQARGAMRDDMAELITDVPYEGDIGEHSIGSVQAERIADALIAAGYRKEPDTETA